MRALLILLAFALPTSAALTTADIIIHADGESRAMLTRSVLSNIVYGSHGIVSRSNVDTNTFTRTYIDTAPSSFAFQSPVTVSSVAYTGTATNWIRFDSVTNILTEYIGVQFPGGADGTISNALVGGFVRVCITNSGESAVNLDHVIIYGGGDSWCVCQLQLNNPNLEIKSHAATSEGSTLGNGFFITPCKTYFRVVYRDPRGGRCCVKFYDPTDWTLAGESCTLMGNVIFANSWWLQLIVGYIGNPPQDVWVGDTFVKYDATNSDYTNAVVTTYTSTFGNATLRNFSK